VVLHSWLAGLPEALVFLGKTTVASVVAVSIVTFLHVVIGEQAPKTWAITYPETTSRWIARPLMFFAWITSPVTNLLNNSATLLVHALGIKKLGSELEQIHSPEEIVMMLRRSQESGHLDREDVRMIEGVFDFTEKLARDVMTPRTEVAGLQASITIGEAAHQAADVGRSRYPVYEDSLDEVVGLVHVKEILAALPSKSDAPVRSVAREPLFVPGTREVEDVLADMKRLKIQLAVVLDEYGGTAGIVTMEDLLEEIVGEIYDEYDTADALPQSSKGGVMLPGDMEIEDINERYKLKLPEDDYQTIGGFVFGQLGRLPVVGDIVRLETVRLEVTKMEKRRVGRVMLVKDGESGIENRES
jgi:magnesium and cobalt exporter, CNNM family